MSLFDVAIPIIMDVSLLVLIDPIPMPKIVLIMGFDLCLCIKCLVLWRFVCCDSQNKDAQESSNARNGEQSPSHVRLLEQISTSKSS
jgi:hypothetical protein